MDDGEIPVEMHQEGKLRVRGAGYQLGTWIELWARVDGIMDRDVKGYACMGHNGGRELRLGGL